MESLCIAPESLPRRATPEPPTLTKKLARSRSPLAAVAAGAGGGGDARPPKVEGTEGAPHCLLYAWWGSWGCGKARQLVCGHFRGAAAAVHGGSVVAAATARSGGASSWRWGVWRRRGLDLGPAGHGRCIHLPARGYPWRCSPSSQRWRRLVSAGHEGGKGGVGVSVHWCCDAGRVKCERPWRHVQWRIATVCGWARWWSKGEEWRRQEGGSCILLSNMGTRKKVGAAIWASLDDAWGGHRPPYQWHWLVSCRWFF
jgi:hypothetical protein